jgi:hypothetical protein
MHMTVLRANALQTILFLIIETLKLNIEQTLNIEIATIGTPPDNQDNDNAGEKEQEAFLSSLDETNAIRLFVFVMHSW